MSDLSKASGFEMSRGPTKAPWLALAVVATLALLLRVVTAGESLWLDELHTSWCVDASLSDVAARARVGNQPPLYFWMLWFVTHLLGPSELSLRLPSLLAGTVSLIIVAVMVHDWTGSRILSLLTSLLVALDPQAIDYAREARPYACVQLLGVLHVICFLRLQRSGTWQARFCWIGLTWLMFYTHYTSVLLLLGELCFLLLAWPCQRWELRRDAAGWLLDLCLCAGGMLIAWSPLAEIAARRQNWARFVPQAAWTEIVRLFAFHIYVFLPAIVVLLLAGFAYRWGVRWKPRTQLIRALTFCSCWYLIPVLTAWIFTQQDWARLLFRRYLIVVGLVPMVIGGALGGLLPRGGARTAYAAVTLALALRWLIPSDPLSPDGLWRRHRREDWRAAIQWINDNPLAGQLPVYLRPGLIEDDALRAGPDPVLRDFCLFPLRGLYKLQREPPATVVLPSTWSWQLSGSQRRPLLRAGKGWMILRQRPGPAAETLRQMKEFLQDIGCQVTIQQQRQFGNVTVILLQTKTETPDSAGDALPLVGPGQLPHCQDVALRGLL